ncbi:MAG: hypothetical protein PHV16_03340 [Candidatus Nanoarchaeia archaeon]|nr:hypothetical protein [Candidatus Nanoarchaeia archaeon]
MVFELTVKQENFLESTYENCCFKDISDKIKQELMDKSRENIIRINTLLENFDINEEKLTEYKDVPIDKVENGFYYNDFEKRLTPIINPDKKKFRDIKIYPTTPEHVAGYFSKLNENMEEHNNLVERNRQFNEIYKNNKSSKLDYYRFYQIIRDSFNESLNMFSASYKLHYGITAKAYERLENQEEPSFRELKNLSNLVEEIR